MNAVVMMIPELKYLADLCPVYEIKVLAGGEDVLEYGVRYADHT
jgi:hypothetical protein